MTANMAYRFIVENPELAKERYQVLCANCNWIKRHVNQEVPRKYPGNT